MKNNKMIYNFLLCSFVVLTLSFLILVGCSRTYNDKTTATPIETKTSYDITVPPDDPPSTTSSIENGRKLVEQRGCLGCHTINGQGGKVGPDLSNEANAGHSRQWLTTQIRDPKKNDSQTLMPAYDTLSDQQVSDIINYLLSLSTARSETLPKTSPPIVKTETVSSQQKSVSLEKAGQMWSQTCGQCHNLRPPSEYSDNQWQVVLDHMRVRVPLTGQQQREILAFLQDSN